MRSSYRKIVNLSFQMRAFTLAVSVLGLLSFIGCLDERLNENPVVVPEEPIPCTASALCRLQNPADTVLLSADQKQKTVALLETIQDSTTVVALTSIDLTSLGADTLRIKLLRDRQVSVHTPVFRVLGIRATDSVVLHGWRGYFGLVADSGYGFVDLTYKNDEIEFGFAVVGGKFLSLEPLGGSVVAVVSVKDLIWMGECSSMSKASSVQLTCADPLP